MYNTWINGRAGTLVIDTQRNGLLDGDFNEIFKIVPNDKTKDKMDLPGSLGAMQCTFTGCRIIFMCDEGVEIKFDSIIQVRNEDPSM